MDFANYNPLAFINYISRCELARAIAKKCGVALGSSWEHTRLRGGHWELYVNGCWQRSTDLLNLT